MEWTKGSSQLRFHLLTARLNLNLRLVVLRWMSCAIQRGGRFKLANWAKRSRNSWDLGQLRDSEVDTTYLTQMIENGGNHHVIYCSSAKSWWSRLYLFHTLAPSNQLWTMKLGFGLWHETSRLAMTTLTLSQFFELVRKWKPTPDQNAGLIRGRASFSRSGKQAPCKDRLTDWWWLVFE